MALDRENIRIYWIDAYLNKLESATYSGEDRRVLIRGSTLSDFHPYGIVFYEGFVFWSNIYNSTVHQARVRNNVVVSQVVVQNNILYPAQIQIVSNSHPRPGGNTSAIIRCCTLWPTTANYFSFYSKLFPFVKYMYMAVQCLAWTVMA